MNALIYTRVASKRQAERSGPRRQEESCREYCARKGWDVVGVWHEVGSAGDGWKALPVLVELVTTILPTYESAVIVAEDFGRFSQAGGDDGQDLADAIRRYGGRLESPQMESPATQRLVDAALTFWLESQPHPHPAGYDPDED